jgi:hypothetical protein
VAIRRKIAEEGTFSDNFMMEWDAKGDDYYDQLDENGRSVIDEDIEPTGKQTVCPFVRNVELILCSSCHGG